MYIISWPICIGNELLARAVTRGGRAKSNPEILRQKLFSI